MNDEQTITTLQRAADTATRDHHLAPGAATAAWEAAWPATKHALKAVGLSMLIEFVASMLAALTWALGIVST